MGVTAEIVRFIHETGFERLPEEVVFRTKTLIADAIGTMLAGSCEDGSRILQEYVKQMGSNSQATVVGTGFKGCAAGAALANAVAGHALDFDSIQLSSWPGTAHGIRIHPTVPALAAALAVGEPQKISGKALILACAVGIEVACRVTEAIPPDSYQVAYQSTATMAGGLRENFGTMTKAFHSGRAAEAGVLATALAQRGFTSAPHILEARRGFFLAMGGQHDPAQISGKLGNPFFIVDPGLHIKRYPCAILVHPAIRAVIELARAHDLTVEKIERMDVGVNDVVTSTLNHPEPRTGLEGKFSVAFPLALALLQGKVGLDDFTDKKVADSRIVALMKKMTVHSDAKLQAAGSNEVTAKLSIQLQDGRRLEHLATLEKGTRDWISESDLREKFRACAARILPLEQANKALDLLLRIEVGENIDALMELVRTQA